MFVCATWLRSRFPDCVTCGPLIIFIDRDQLVTTEGVSRTLSNKEYQPVIFQLENVDLRRISLYVFHYGSNIDENAVQIRLRLINSIRIDLFCWNRCLSVAHVDLLAVIQTNRSTEQFLCNQTDPSRHVAKQKRSAF